MCSIANMSFLFNTYLEYFQHFATSISNRKEQYQDIFHNTLMFLHKGSDVYSLLGKY